MSHHHRIRATARSWLKTVGRKPKDTVRLKLSAETAAMAAFYLRELGPLPEHGDAGQVRERMLFLLDFACTHGRAQEYRKTAGFSRYTGPKR